MVTTTTLPEPLNRTDSKKNLFAYRILLVFSFLYFARPEDFVPGLAIIPVAKITGGLALLALFLGWSSGSIKKKFPIELRLLTALFFWQCLTVPFAWYRSGALSYVTGRCSKTLMVAILVTFVVTSVARLRKLMYIQAAAVTTITVASVLMYRGGRMGGALGGVFANPNDLAMNIAMNWPLCLMFLLRTKSLLKKLLWGVGMIFLIRGLMLTYSRTGFLAIGVAMLFCLIEFGMRGKRHYLIFFAVVGLLVALLFVPSGYTKRMGSIFGEPLQKDDSQEQRRELFMMSLKITATHPLFGIGPGNFQGYTESWHVTHNTYTELTSECGIPALILFLLVIRAAFRNLKRTRKSQLYATDPDVRFITGGLWASLAPYLVGACFSSTAYQLFPYFLVAYTTALFTIAVNPSPPRKQGDFLWKAVGPSAPPVMATKH